MKKLNSVEQRKVLKEVIKNLRKNDDYYICLIVDNIINNNYNTGYDSRNIYTYMPAFNKYIFDIGKTRFNNNTNISLVSTFNNISAWIDKDMTSNQMCIFKIKAINTYIKRLDKRIAKHKKR